MIQETYRVTDRPYEETIFFAHIDEEEIIALPSNSRILDIGSGTTQETVRGILSIRNDIQTISIDPTLGFNSTGWRLRQERSTKYTGRNILTYWPSLTGIRNTKIDTFQKGRRLNSQNAIAVRTPPIPFVNDSIDLTLDIFGPYIYIPLFQRALYLKELIRVTRPGGSIRIFPLEKFALNTDSDTITTQWKEKYQLLSNLCITPYTKQYIEYNHRGQSRETERVGLIIHKQ